MKKTKFFAALCVAVSLFVSGCGGGGGGSSSAVDAAANAITPSTFTPKAGIKSALPTLTEDTEPAGMRLDLRSKNYFPSNQGDHWTYSFAQNAGMAPNEAARTISVADSAHFVVVESSGSSSSATPYMRSSGGAILGAEGILGTTAPNAAKQIVGSFVEYAEPFFPIGAERKLLRQGDWGQDLDGDGVNEGFRLVFSQTLLGMESLQTQLGSVETVHFRSVLTFTLVPSNAARSSVTVVQSEETWWAAGLGLMQATREVRPPDGSVSTELLSIKAGVVNGKDIALNWALDGTLIKIALPHTSLIYDGTRNRYLASVPGSVAINGNSLAMVDAVSGAVTYSRPLGSEPSVLALSSLGDFLYVGLRGSGELVKYRLPDLTEQWRVRLPSDSFFGQTYAQSLAVDPTNPDVVAVSTSWSGVSPGHAGVALVRSGVIQAKLTQRHTGSNLVAFDGSGQYLYGYNTETTEFGLRRIAVLPDGLQEIQVVATNGGFGAGSLTWTSDGIWLGANKYNAADLGVAGVVSGGSQCRPLANPLKVVCLDTDFLATRRLLVIADASTFVVGAKAAYAATVNVAAASRLVPGPANQVALRLDDTYSPSVYYASIWLFTSPTLN